ncbi:Beta-hexosaminidase [Thalassocella blandensis]|nr:Beta-hexosaminidase [Thalassocella blandensis]
MLDISGVELSEEDREVLRHPQVGGVIFFARNFESPEQLKELIRSIRSVRYELVLAVDQEGGRVQRFKQGFTLLPPLQKLGNVYQESPEVARGLTKDIAWLMASELLAYDMDLSFAPVLDVDDHKCLAIGDRSLSADQKLVCELGQLYIEGMHEAGMAATGKHFPGHGAVTADSHKESPKDRRSLQEIESQDLRPFVVLANKLDAIMPAHVIFSSVDPNPVGFSPFWLKQYLRERLKFQGTIFSDDLSMEGAAVVGDYASRVQHALEAGCDVTLVCNHREGAIQSLEYLETRQYKAEFAALERMRKRHFVQLTALQNNERWLATQHKIDQYGLV